MAAQRISTGIVDEYLREVCVGDTIKDENGKQYVVTRRDLASPTCGGSDISLATLKGITVVIDNIAKERAAGAAKPAIPISRDKIVGIHNICMALGLPTAGVRQAVRAAGIETTKKGKNIYVRQSDRELVEQIAKQLHGKKKLNATISMDATKVVEAVEDVREAVENLRVEMNEPDKNNKPLVDFRALGEAAKAEQAANEEEANIKAIANGVKDASDQRLVEELRARGWKVACTKIVEKIVYEQISI